MLLSGFRPEEITGLKYPTLRTRLDSDSMIPRATTDLPLLGSIPAIYKLRAMVILLQPIRHAFKISFLKTVVSKSALYAASG
jgi:hypothetical protein